MGLLDALNSRDGIFALGLLDAASPRPVRTSLGGGLLAALQGAQGWQQAQDDRATAAEERRQRAAMQALQMDVTRGQLAQQQQAIAAAQRQAAEQQRIQGLLRSAFSPVSPIQANAASGIAGPRPEALAAVGQPPPVDFQALLAQGVPADLVKALGEARNYGRDEVARTVEIRDAQGQPAIAQFDKFGGQVGAPLQQWKAPVFQNLGDRTVALDPATQRVLAQFQQGQSPDSKASNALGWANHATSERRLTWDMQQPRGQFDSDRGLLIDPRTGVATPVTQGGLPIGAKDKGLNDAQSKALLFGSRMQAADQTLTELAKSGTTTQVPGADAGYGIGHVVNQLLTPQQQQLGQAKRDFINATLRRESGAVISDAEFANAELQYFPQIGDSREVIAQKARNRALATRGVMAEVPEGKRSMLSPASAAPLGGLPSLADIEAELARRGGR